MNTKSTVLYDSQKPKSYYIFTMESEIQLPIPEHKKKREKERVKQH